MPRLPTAAAGPAIVFVLALLATSFDGATVHLPALLLRGLVAVGCVLLWPSSLVTLRYRDLMAPAVGLLAVSVGWLHTDNAAPAIQAVVSTLLVVALYAAIIVSRPGVSFKLLVATVAVGTVHAVWAVAQQLLDASMAARAGGGFFSPNDLAALLAPLVVLAAGTALGTGPVAGVSRATERIVAASVTLLMFAGLLATGSRSGMAAAAIGTAIVVMSRLRQHPWALASLVAATLLIGSLFVDRWTGSTDQYAYARLTAIWPRSISLALDNPAGVGLSDYAGEMRVFGIPFDGWVRYPKHASNAHSEPLNAWVEIGWLGLLATLLAPLFMAAVLWRRRGEPPGTDDWSTATHWGVLIALGLPALVSASLHVPPIGLFAALWAGHVVRADGRAGPGLTIGSRIRGRVMVGLVCCMAILLALPGAVARTAMDRASRLRDSRQLPEAFRAAELAESVAPFSLNAALLAESLRFLNGKPPDAVAERLFQLVERHPRAPKPVDRLIWILEKKALENGSSPEQWSAIAGLRAELVRRDPLDAHHRINLAKARLRAGDPQAAGDALRAALEIEPHCADALAHLALLAHRAGRLDEAQELANDAWLANIEAKGRKAAETRVLSLAPNLAKMLVEAGLGSL